MSIQVLEQTPVDIDLVELARTTGWSVDGAVATHEKCNAGSIFLTSYNIVAGQSYEISYTILSNSDGTVGVQPYAGTSPGVARTTTGFVKETIIAQGANPEFRFYSDANCSITNFNIRNTLQSTDLKKINTIAWSEENNKWGSFYTYVPDVAFSMFVNHFLYKQGQLFVQHYNSSSRNNFFGTQYQSILQVVSNEQPLQTKSFLSLALESNQLMITTVDGIQTSLGQLSDLSQKAFLKHTLTSGVTTLAVYSNEGVYSAAFRRDKNSKGGLINGDVLKGNYCIIELTTIDNSILRLFSITVHSEPSRIGVR